MNHRFYPSLRAQGRFSEPQPVDNPEIANMLWAQATMGARADRGLLEAMQRRATATARNSKPQNVANVLWALATMGERADRWLLEAMQRRETATAGEFKPQGIL